jgi:hypothetical protein
MSVINVKKKELIKRNIADFASWKSQENTVYIGRNMSHYVTGASASKWGNPFSLKKHTLKESLDLYKEYVLNTPSLFNSIEELRGKELGCWCKPAECHGDVLLELLGEIQ